MEAPTILIVDDEKNIRETVAHALEPAARRILQAVDAESALSALSEEDIDVLFLDLRLPDRSGMDVLRTVQLSHPDTAVIVMTAYADVESAVEAMRFGAMDFLRKPFSPASLRQSLSTALAVRARIAHDHAGDAPGVIAASGSDDATGRATARAHASAVQMLKGARASLHAGAYAAAESQLRAALAADPLNPAAFNLLGAIRELENRITDAQIFYRLAVTVDMHYAPAQTNLDRLSSWPRSGAIDYGTGDTDVTHA